MIVLDTDIFIDFLSGRQEAEELIQKHANDIAFSAITEAELLSGSVCENAREREGILHFLSQFQKVPVDNPLVQVAGALRRTHKVALPDCIIAATALVTGSTLLTRNIKDYKNIKELQLRKPYS